MTLNNILGDAKAIAITGHVKPDGDCVGSCMGLYLYLTENYKNLLVDIYLEEIPNVFHFISGSDKIHHTYGADTSTGRRYDLLFCLDASDKARLGAFASCFDNAARTVCIDHHISNNGYADSNLISPESSSTSEMIFELLDADKISKETAEAIYLGIVHDTGVFKFNCTSRRTMEIAGELMEKGIDFTKIVEDTFYKKTYVQNQILGRALLESVMFFDGKCIMAALSKKSMDFFGVIPSDLDGIVNQLKVTEGVEVAIFLYEIESCVYKVSMRSNGKVDVSKIASLFGGGGHKMAAGCNFTGTIHDVVNNLSHYIERQLADL